MKIRLLSLFVILMTFSVLALSEPLAPIIEKSPLDDREYIATVLENGLRVIVVSDKDAPTSGAAIIVNAGLYDDPKQFPGLAHFLEHMLFLGTKRYPVPDEFQNFIQAHGGERNATTEGEKTAFFFSIQPIGFGAALERFADFFISPTFYPEYVDRELNAVEQEFHLFLHKDEWAAHEVNKETSNPQHPFHDYFAGNIETLGQDKENLKKALRDFFEKHYHADNLTLALVGPHSTRELLFLAKQHFSAIAKTPKEYRKIARGPLYSENEKGIDVYLKSKGHYQELSLTFAFSHETDITKRKSKELVPLILGYDGRGGLSSALKKQNWIVDMSAAYERLSEEQDGILLNFSLTEDGIKHINDITRYVFNAISLIKKKGIPKNFYDEIKAVNQASFLYFEKYESTTLALALARKLQDTPVEALLTAKLLLPKDEVSQELIRTWVSQELTPQNMRRFIITQNEEGNKQSKWYQASYRVEKISERQMKKMIRPIIFSGLTMPEKNRFVPKNLNLVNNSEHSQSEPQKIREDSVTLWYSQDTQFNKPKGTILINFYAPWVADSAENTLLAKMYSKMLSETLVEKFYPAGLAGMYISLSEHARGLTLNIGGYSDKQDVLLREILHSIKKFKIQEADFEGTRDTLVRRIKNFDQRTLFEKGHAELHALLFSPAWHPDELLPISENLTSSKLEWFKQNFWKNIHVEMLVYGNYTTEQAQKLGVLVEHSLPEKPVGRSSVQGVKIAELSKGVRYYRHISNRKEENHVALWYLQNQTKDYDTLAKTLMLANLVQVPYFQTLRVEKQLGYALGANPFTLKEVSGLLFWIQSTKADSNKLVKEIKTFLTDYKKQLVKLDNSAYMMSREALINQLLQPAQTLDEQASRWWASIENGDITFNYNVKIAEALKQVDLKKMVTFTNKLFDPASIDGQLFVLSAVAPIEKEERVASIKQFRESLSFLG